MDTLRHDDSEWRSVHAAMNRLHWHLRDLFIATLQYGDIGTEADLREYLDTGDHLTPAQRRLVVATLNDGLLMQGDLFRI